MKLSRPNTSLPEGSRSGFTLMELAVVMAVLSVVAVAATSMLGGRESVSSLQARQEAQILAAAIRTARTTAIAEATSVRLQAIPSGRQVTGFRISADGRGPVQPDHLFPGELRTTWSDNELVFQATGLSSVLLEVQVSGARSTWTVSQVSATGQTSVRRTR